MKQRNINLDVIRCVALMYVLCVHFFLNTNIYFYSTISDTTMRIGILLRNVFLSCVPLFLMLTGYLMNHKKLSVKYYVGISKVLIIYGISCIPIWIFRIVEGGETFNLFTLYKSYTEFEAYAWYIGLYIELYALIPFLNLIYHNLNSKKQKLLLIIIFMILTAFPSFTNRFGVALIPQHLEAIYPITYYFMGAFLSEYADDFKTPAVGVFFVYIITALTGGCYVNMILKDKWYYDVNFFSNYENLMTTCITPILFLALLKCDFSRMPKPICKLVGTVSQVSLQMYLVSYIFDILVYRDFNAQYPVYADKLIRFPLPIIKVFILSFIVALPIQFIYNQIKKISTQA